MVKRDDLRPPAAQLLGDWRAAERDTAAAKTAGSVADLALAAAAAAEEAARETELAARAALDAADRARAAADRVRKAVAAIVEAAQLSGISAQGDVARAAQQLGRAEAAETVARARFHAAEEQGFREPPE